MCLLPQRQRIVLLALLVTFSAAASPQTTSKFVTSKEDALHNVPSDQRSHLTDRLELYVRSSNAVDLDQIYTLMPRACTHGLDRSSWRKQVHVQSFGLLRAFSVEEIYAGDYTSVANVDGDKWIATGCGTYRRDKKTVTYKASINLVFANDEWYICGSGVAVEGKHKKPIPCHGT